MKQLNPVFVLLCFVFAAFSCSSPKEVVLVDPITVDKQFAFDFVKTNSFDLVLDKAAEEDKLVFVDFYASWCLPCKMMEDDVFSHEPTAREINSDFVSYKVDAEEDYGQVLAFNYDIKSYPTLLFLDTQGNVLERKDGIAYHRELLEMAKNAKSKAPALTMR